MSGTLTKIFIRSIFISIFSVNCFSSIIDASINLVRAFPLKIEKKRKGKKKRNAKSMDWRVVDSIKNILMLFSSQTSIICMEEKLVVLGQLKRSNFYKAGIWNRPRSPVSKICLWIWGCLSRKLLTILWNWKNLLSITFWSGGFKTCQTTNSLIEIILDKTFAQKLRAIFKFLVLPKLISQQGYPGLKFV